MERWLARGALPAVLLALVAGAPTVAHARAQQAYAHNFDQCWSAAIRVLRVDYGFPIRDQDKDIGYVLFDYQDRGRTFPGSVELIRARVDGRDQIKVTITIPAMPTYIEQMILTRLGRKLLDDFGEPPPPPRRPPAEPPNEPDEPGEGDRDPPGDHPDEPPTADRPRR